MNFASPLVSIVIPTFNSSRTIVRCLSSLASISAFLSQVIIVDACSQDDTLSLVDSFTNKLPIKTISEPDDGISDAFNKGIMLADSPYIFLLGSDDEILPEGFLDALQLLEAHKPGILLTSIATNHTSRRYSSMIHLSRFFNSFIHPGSFFSSDVYREIGLYDTSLLVAMDYDMFCRACQAGILIQNIPSVATVIHYSGGASESLFLCFKESFLIRRRYYKAIFPVSEVTIYFPRIIKRLLLKAFKSI